MADPTQPMIDWINTAPPPEVAVEVIAAFGPDGLHDRQGGSDANHGLSNVIDFMFREYPSKPRNAVHEAVLEAMQLLEHAELIYVRIISGSERYWSATRLGLATLASGKDSVRQRIADRTGL